MMVIRLAGKVVATAAVGALGGYGSMGLLDFYWRVVTGSL